MNRLEKQQYIYGYLFLLANKLQAIGDQYLKNDGMTVKQWFLTVVIMRFGDHPPTLRDVADLMGSSYQNVKQLALKLEKNGFLSIEDDKKDARAFRLKLTPKCSEYWNNRINEDDQFIRELFTGIGERETEILFKCFNQLYGNINNLEKPKELTKSKKA